MNKIPVNVIAEVDDSRFNVKFSIRQFSPTVITVELDDTVDEIIQDDDDTPINDIPSGIINPFSLYVPGDTITVSPDVIPEALKAAVIVKNG